MIIALPASSPTTASVGTMAPSIGQSSFILHERAREHEWSGSSGLSIKTFFGGQAHYHLGSGRCAVDDTAYLVVNHGQPYSITIESTANVESFCIFFAAGFAEEVWRSMVSPTDRLLTDPQHHDAGPLHFFDKRYPHDDHVSPVVRRIRRAVAEGSADHGWLSEQYHALMQQLLQVHWNVYREVETLPAARAATRAELYRRLYRARDFAAASLHETITLGEMAAVACLSPNHFLRSFRQAFGQTPHQYLTSLRLLEAQRMLAATEQSVTEICFSVGFVSVGSFSSLFRRHIGVSPEAYRRQMR